MTSKRRLYKDFDLDLDQIEKSEVKELILHAGQLYKISGLVFQGNEETFLVMFPTACDLNVSTECYQPPWPLTVEEIFYTSLQELQAILKRTDDPLVFQEDETEVLKAIIRKSQMPISGATQQQIWLRDGFQCMYCGGMIGKVTLTIDHWIPLEKGGENNPSNYLTACHRCNKRKGNNNPVEYCAKEGFDYTGLELYINGQAPKTFIGHLQ